MADQTKWTEGRERGRYGEGDRTRRASEDFGRGRDYGSDDRERGGGYGGYGAGRYSESYGDYGRSFERGDNAYETGGGSNEGGYGGRYGAGRSERESRYGGRWGHGPEGQDSSRQGYDTQGHGGGGQGASQGYARFQEYGGERDRGGAAQGDHDRTWMERTGEKIGQFFTGDREGGHRGRGPKNYTRSEDRIREDVNDRLTDDPWLDASEIDVQVSKSEVTLNGSVESREDKRRAEDLVEQVSGVGHVQNNLRVQQTGAGSTTGATGAGASSGATTTGGSAGTASGTAGRTGGARPI